MTALSPTFFPPAPINTGDGRVYHGRRRQTIDFAPLDKSYSFSTDVSQAPQMHRKVGRMAPLIEGTAIAGASVVPETPTKTPPPPEQILSPQRPPFLHSHSVCAEEAEDNQYVVSGCNNAYHRKASTSSFSGVHVESTPNAEPATISTSTIRRRSIFQSALFSPQIRKPKRKTKILPFPVQRKGRLIGKAGSYCVKETNIPQRSLQYIRDIYTTLIEVPWYYTALVMSVSYVMCYFLFTMLYYGESSLHGDFAPERNITNWKNCIQEGVDLVTIFLFSFETQHTIGYGFRYVTEKCAPTMIISMLQVWSGIVLQSFMTAIAISKLTRPKRRAKTLLFSKNAVVAQRDGQLCLMFRVGDMRKTHLIDARVRLIMIRSYVTKEKEFLPFHQFDLAVGFQRHEQDSLFLAWPTIICHIIDEQSPLYDYSRQDMSEQEYEVIAILEGTVESTGQATQARTSYRPKEILWGHRFETLLTYQDSNGEYGVNYARFHRTYAIDTPDCSAREFHEDHLGSRANITDPLADARRALVLSESISPTNTFTYTTAQTRCASEANNHNANANVEAGVGSTLTPALLAHLQRQHDLSLSRSASGRPRAYLSDFLRRVKKAIHR